ncbi:MAG TPA: BTAD domain-containing putative transcriptional regulator [Trebonia sp.]
MRRALTRAWRLLRALAGIAVIAALLAGLPWGLAAMTGSPLPRSWPGWAQAQRFLASPLSDVAIIRFLADAAWLLWAVFALSLVIELIAVTRGQPAPRLPAIAPVQALAAALVGATMMTALHVPRAQTRTAPPLHAALTSAVTISAPLVPGQTAQLTAASATAARAYRSTTQARPRVYRVREDDDLWDIAERFLGDPEEWHQIYQLNEGRPQPDGRCLTDPNLIIPGWVLLIPQPASAHAPAPHPGRPGTAAPGAGQTPQPSPRPSRTATPSPRPSRPAEPTAQPSQSAGPTARPSRATPSPGPSSGRSAPGRGTHPPQVSVRLPSGTLIGIGVAVMVAAAIALASIQRRRRYRPRPGPPSTLAPETPPLPEVISALRRAARPPLPAAGPETGDQDAALVTGPDGEDLTAEDPYADLYEALPAPDADSGSAAPGNDPDSVPQPETEHPARRELPPGTVPAGVRGDDGAAVDIDIAALGGLGLTGPGAEPAARAILAALLAQAPPGDTGLPVVIIPAADAARLLFGAGPATIPGLAVPATAEAALGELEALQLTLARLSGAGDDLADAGPAPGPGGPGVTLIAASEPGLARRLAGILDAGRRTGTAAVLLGTWPAGTTCQVAADGTVTAVTPPNPDLDGIRLFTLGAAEAAAITGILQEAGGNPPAPRLTPPAPADRQRPEAAGPAPRIRYLGAPEAPPRPALLPDPAPAPPAVTGQPEPAAPAPSAADRPVQLALLGPLRITAAGQEVAGGMRKARELLAFLAVQPPDGASGEAISEALWPEADPGRAAGQRNLALRKAREMLRAAAGLSEPRWILNASGRYRLDPALIGTDLEAFGEALEAARTASGDARLAACRRAVGLYRGELAEGAGYEWAEPYAETARRRALDAWTVIAEILQPSDPGQALSALETALSHDPYNEYLYVRIMRLQAAAGHPEAVRRTLGLLESKLTDLNLAPSSQTRQAAAALLAAAPGPEQQQQLRPAPGQRPGDGQRTG